MEAVLYFVTTSWHFLKTGTGLFSSACIEAEAEAGMNSLGPAMYAKNFHVCFPLVVGQYEVSTLLGQSE